MIRSCAGIRYATGGHPSLTGHFHHNAEGRLDAGQRPPMARDIRFTSGPRCAPGRTCSVERRRHSFRARLRRWRDESLEATWRPDLLPVWISPIPRARVTGRRGSISSQSASGLVLALFMWGHMVVRLVDPARQGRDVDDHEVLRGLFLLRPLLSVDRLAAWSRSVIALIVAHALLAVRKFPINYRQFATFRGHMRTMRHEDTTLWFWQVITGFALFFLASVHLYIMLTRPERIGPFEIRRPRVERSLLAALHRAAADGRGARRHRPLPPRGEVGLVRRAPTRTRRGAGSRSPNGRSPSSSSSWALRRSRPTSRSASSTATGTASPTSRRTCRSGQPAGGARLAGGDPMNVIYTDVLVIGGGLAGLRVAIGAKRRGHDVIILSLVPPKRSHSAAAQGGMQASLGNVIKGQGDNEDVHFEDTVRGSDWGADQRVVRMFVNTAPKAVRELAAWGVPWSRVRKGDRTVIINNQKVTITERDEAHGLVAQRDFGGTKKWRTCYVSGRHGPRDAADDERSGDRRGDSRARADRGDRADPRRGPLLRRDRPQPRHRRARRVRRQGHGDRERRRRPPLSRDDQCA